MTGYFKRFGDFCAGFAIFAALLFLFREYMIFRPTQEDAEGMREKLSLFFSDQVGREYQLYLVLIALLLFSIIFSLLFKKFPYIGFAVSLLPLTDTVLLLVSDRLYERPMLYLVLALLHTASGLFACIDADRQDRGHRAALGADLCALFLSGFCLMLLLRAPSIPQKLWSECTLFEKQMYDALLQGKSMGIFVFCAIFYAVLALLRLLWRDL